MPKPKIKIDIVSDVVCPWCYIGKRRVERAVELLQATYDFDIRYHPFELNPTLPQSGVNQKEYLSKKLAVKPGTIRLPAMLPVWLPMRA